MVFLVFYAVSECLIQYDRRGENNATILELKQIRRYTQINHHAGTPKKHNKYKRYDKQGYSSFCYIGSRMG